MKIMKSEKGFALVEVLVATFIMVTVGVGLLGGLTLTSKVIASTDRTETARDLAVAEMEYIKSLIFDADHYSFDPALIPPGSSYSVSVTEPQSLEDGNLQLVTVIISSEGREVIRLSDYKVNW